jgi:Bacteriocin-protection, YdeI or OmpD-Associated
MHPAGLEAFAARDPVRSGIYTYERPQTLDPAYEQQLRAHPEAWQFFQSQPPWYRRTVSSWIMSAKREETRHRRLAALIEDSAHHRRIGILNQNRG